MKTLILLRAAVATDAPAGRGSTSFGVTEAPLVSWIAGD
ncbi:hypothetical protein Pd630_LPD10013 (plasmid) [Rhodococcus opacus PD630]|nr:hypothetical protein Pd630_LPD10013 [Rhodococcus opacus PD630]